VLVVKALLRELAARAREASKRVGRRLLAREGRLVFDDKAPALLTTLELKA
jgi:hypothetical protein